MNESIDNKLENLFFEIIVKNNNLNGEILKIFDLINSQNISKNDKLIINKKIFGFNIVNEDDEINKLLEFIRNDEIKNYLLYKIIFDLIENILDIEDSKHLSLLLSNTKEDIETDIIYFLRDILELISKNLKKLFNEKKVY